MEGEMEISVNSSIRIIKYDRTAIYFCLPGLQRAVNGRIAFHLQLLFAKRTIAVEQFARRSPFREVADGLLQIRHCSIAVVSMGIAHPQCLICQELSEVLISFFCLFLHAVGFVCGLVKLVVPYIGFCQHCPDVVIPLALVVLGTNLHAPCRELFERVGLVIIIIGKGLLQEHKAGVVPIDGIIRRGRPVTCSMLT